MHRSHFLIKNEYRQNFLNFSLVFCCFQPVQNLPQSTGDVSNWIGIRLSTVGFLRWLVFVVSLSLAAMCPPEIFHIPSYPRLFCILSKIWHLNISLPFQIDHQYTKVEGTIWKNLVYLTTLTSSLLLPSQWNQHSRKQHHFYGVPPFLECDSRWHFTLGINTFLLSPHLYTRCSQDLHLQCVAGVALMGTRCPGDGETGGYMWGRCSGTSQCHNNFGPCVHSSMFSPSTT